MILHWTICIIMGWVLGAATARAFEYKTRLTSVTALLSAVVFLYLVLEPFIQ